MIEWFKNLFAEKKHDCTRDGHEWTLEDCYIEKPANRFVKGVVERVIVTKACKHCPHKHVVPARVPE